MSKHAILSASGAHRWLNCTPSARLELEFDDNSGEAAAEGTAAHALSEHKLRNPYKNRRYLTCQLNPITFRAVDMLPQTIKIRVS